MAEDTKIEWADDTFNPWEGCQETGSPACVNCYAKARNARFNGGVAINWGPHAPRRRTSEANWRKPLKWDEERAQAIHRAVVTGAALPPPRFVFCASLADVFDNAVPAEWRRDLFDLIRRTPHLTWLLLTKRPQMIVKLFMEAHLDPPDGGSGYPWPSNAAIGCTVVTQEEANRDLPYLLHAKTLLKPAFAFTSMEPLIETVDLTRLSTWKFRGAEQLNALTGALSGMLGEPAGHLAALDWVIAGGMSGAKAEPSHPDLYRSLRDQCAAAGVPFLFKQWGEYAWTERIKGDPSTLASYRAGKKYAGRLLDGVTHDARPLPRAA